MWIMYNADAAYVQSKVPTRITQEQCDTILGTPQGGDLPDSSNL